MLLPFIIAGYGAFCNDFLRSALPRAERSAESAGFVRTIFSTRKGLQDRPFHTIPAGNISLGSSAYYPVRRRLHRASPPPWAKGAGTRRRRGGGAAGAGFARVSPLRGDRLRRDPHPSAKPRQRIKPFPMQKVPPSMGRTSGCFSGLSPRHWAADGWDCRSRSQDPSPRPGVRDAPSPRTAGYRYCRRSGCRWKG